MSDMIIIQQRRTQNFTTLGNETIRDRRLSYRARGLHHVLLSLAEGYQLRVSWLVDHGPDGRHSVLGGLKELKCYGYLAIRRERDGSGRFVRTTWVITDTPELDSSAPPSEIRTVEESSHDSILGDADIQTVSTEEPSVKRTTTTTDNTETQLPAGDEPLVMPKHLAERERNDVASLLRNIPAADAQVLLDELSAVMEVPGTIKTTPTRWFYGLVQKYARGQFNPVGALAVASRRAKSSQVAKVEKSPPASPEVARAHLAKIAATLHMSGTGVR